MDGRKRKRVGRDWLDGWGRQGSPGIRHGLAALCICSAFNANREEGPDRPRPGRCTALANQDPGVGAWVGASSRGGRSSVRIRGGGRPRIAIGADLEHRLLAASAHPTVPAFLTSDTSPSGGHPRIFQGMHPTATPTVILDNGASTIKAGILGIHDQHPRVIPNAVVRAKADNATYIGYELANCRDFTSLRFRLPFEKGFLVDWDAQKAVWDGLFSTEVLAVNTSDASLLITEPYFNLPNIQDVYDQFMFEEYEFRSYFRSTPASLISHGRLFAQHNLPPPECLLIIDSGFSFTHVVPVLNGQVVWEAVKRIDVGGKLLTNHLKETVSYRHWNMMEETHIMNEIKEACCFVSEDFAADLETCRARPTANPIVQEYIFPDYSARRPGRIRNPGESLDESTQQTLRMANERFSVPEILFHPTNIGLDQAGLSATVAASIALLPEDLQGMFWANIGLIGGNTAMPGFRDRLTFELRSLAPIECAVRVYASTEPILEAYRSAVAFAARPEFASHCAVTREEYLEMGSSACRRKFRDWKPAPVERDREQQQPPASRSAARGKARSRGSRSSGRDSASEDEDSDEDGNGNGGSPRPAQPTKRPGRGRGRGRGARGGGGRRGA